MSADQKGFLDLLAEQRRTQQPVSFPGLGGDLHFGRFDLDGVPYQGPAVPLKEQEYEEFTELRYRADVRLFDLSIEDQRVELQRIVEFGANGWWQIVRMEHQFVPQQDGTCKVYVYCVWHVPLQVLDEAKISQHGLSVNGFGG